MLKVNVCFGEMFLPIFNGNWIIESVFISFGTLVSGQVHKAALLQSVISDWSKEVNTANPRRCCVCPKIGLVSARMSD